MYIRFAIMHNGIHTFIHVYILIYMHIYNARNQAQAEGAFGQYGRDPELLRGTVLDLHYIFWDLMYVHVCGGLFKINEF